MPLLETKGAASAQGFGLTLQQAAANYIEDVFSTYIYPGNGSTQTITNGIDLAGKGGLVFVKCRNETYNWRAFDSARGFSNSLFPNLTSAQNAFTDGGYITATSSTGFTVGQGTDSGVVGVNASGFNYASWTFRKQPKFFDVVTWTGNGANPRQIAHNLGSVPGCIIVKSTTRAENWTVYHRSLGNAARMALNTSDAQVTGTGVWASTTPTSTHFTVSADNLVNFNGDGYVAYLFAHNAGGFGLTGTDNVISCGSFTTNGSGNATVNLGYEPQWVMVKDSSQDGNWDIIDNMRGFPVTGDDRTLRANLSNTEAALLGYLSPNATGFSIVGSATATYIYIAIRRGPMRTPTTGTSVFNPLARTGTGTNPTVVTTTNNPDLLMSFPRTASPDAYGMCFWDKLRGVTEMLQSWTTGAQTATNSTRTLQGWLNTGYQAGADFIEGYLNYSGSTYVNYPITRAPGFFDEVCYTGNNVYQQAQSHNLGVVPELIIVKQRDFPRNWAVGCNFTNTEFQYLNLNSGADGGNTNAYTTGGFFGGKPTATTFILAQNSTTNSSGGTYVAYLFASCPGVSKVGTYTGTGTTLQIDCGFTGGARFVLIKRLGTNTDAGVGGWHVWDSARGIVSGNDPYLLLNSSAAEVTNTDYVDTYSAGFEISSTAPAAINANGGTYIYLAIA